MRRLNPSCLGAALGLLALLAPMLPAVPPDGVAPPRVPHLVDNPEPPAAGKFLVAARGLADPNFRETVVLLIEHDEEGSWGLIINRPTPVRLSDLLPDEKSLQGRDDTLLLGGPVAPLRLLVLFRSVRPPQNSRPVFDDVHLTWSQANLRSLGSGNRTVFRLYAGYAGWGPGQLAAEMSRGDWHVLPADADLVFSEHPEDVWELLARRAPLQVAVGRPSAGRPGMKNPGASRRRGHHSHRGVCRHPV